MVVGDFFTEGQEVKAIIWPNNSMLSVDQHDIEKITVINEFGQMSGVPWFAVWKKGKIASKHNSAYIESVIL